MSEFSVRANDSFRSLRSASDVLNAHWDGSIPVKIVTIAREVGIQVYKSPNLDANTSGYCHIKDGEVRIVVNQFENVNRRRFTVAHELGHIILGHLQDEPKLFRSDSFDVFDSPKFASSKEIEANKFAAEILMPTSAVLKYYRAQVVKNTESLASLFQVSTQAMYFRLKNLGVLT